MAMNVRLFALWCSFMHANLVLLLVPVGVGVPVWRLLAALMAAKPDASWATLAGMLRDSMSVLAPNFLQQFVAGMAGAYYTLDFVMMWVNVHPLTSVTKLWFSVHHIFCWLGLMWPAFFAPSMLDAALSQVGFWFGEVSNPPRCIVDLVQAEIDTAQEQHEAATARRKGAPHGATTTTATMVPFVTLLGRVYPVRRVYAIMNRLQMIHLVLFFIFRIIGTRYFTSVVWPYAALPMTNVTGGVTLALSLMALVFMVRAPMPSAVSVGQATPSVDTTVGGATPHTPHVQHPVDTSSDGDVPLAASPGSSAATASSSSSSSKKKRSKKAD